MSNTQNNDLKLQKNSTRSIVYVIAISSAFNMARWIGLDSKSILLWSFPFFSALISLFFLHKSQQTSSFKSSLIFWTNYLVVTYVIGHVNYFLASSDIGFSPFGGFKLAAFAIALIAPYPLLNGYLSLLGCAIMPTIMYYTILSDYHSRMTVQEPGLTVVTAVVCFLVYMYRHRGLKIERELSKLKTDKENLEELAKIFLSLRDLTNTPIQNLMLVSTLLIEDKINSERAAKYLNVSTQQLSLISQILSEFRLADRSLEEFRSIYTQSDPLQYLKGRILELQKKVDSSFKDESGNSVQ